MKREVIALFVYLTVIWSSFVFWELHITKWVIHVNGPIMRIDLIVILPILIGITIYVVYQVLANIKN